MDFITGEFHRKAKNVLFLGVCDMFSFSLSCSSVISLAVSETLPTSGQLLVSTMGAPLVGCRVMERSFVIVKRCSILRMLDVGSHGWRGGTRESQ